MAKGGRKVKPALPELGHGDHFRDELAYPGFIVVTCPACSTENVSAESEQLRPGDEFNCVECGAEIIVPDYEPPQYLVTH